ncbi:MAG: hypothetical protein JO364_11920 [Pseudonocardiales bacterium]|nr:hypothetical protein [Pseudonocardiales bacterium]MBV9030961.1 hypothetical protein [Pseudonocardiales bacterium]MBV9030982.1 hypothetical protein [Pseudonocardiales bacterium]
MEIRWEAPEPLLPEESDLGIAVAGAGGGGALPRHRLVTLGDSLTMGVKSFAIVDTGLSWPAILADTMGLGENDFTYPRFSGPADCPGLPLNLEAIVRGIDLAGAGSPVGVRQLREALAVTTAVSHVKSYWEHGPGSIPPGASASYHHNLAIYGWNVRDAYTYTVGDALAALASRSTAFSPMVSHNGDRAMLRTLQGPSVANPDASGTTTMVDAARWLGRDGGIDTLVVALGSNNVLPSVVTLRLVWSSGPHSSGYTVSAPADFETDLGELRDRIAEIDARRVIWATVPHVTVAPVARGVGVKPSGSRYFTRYTHAWITDAEFDPAVNPYLTGEQARAIDSAIDQYNYSIKRLVYAARTAEQPRDWLLLDMCGLLDRLAYRRYIDSPDSRPSWWDAKGYDLPTALKMLTPRPDTRFFQSDASGRTQGGLVALDGMHPTTIGYGILAQEALAVMAHAGATPPQQVDFARLVSADTLISDAPRSLTDDLGAVRSINEMIDIGLTLLGRRAV